MGRRADHSSAPEIVEVFDATFPDGAGEPLSAAAEATRQARTGVRWTAPAALGAIVVVVLAVAALAGTSYHGSSHAASTVLATTSPTTRPATTVPARRTPPPPAALPRKPAVRVIPRAPEGYALQSAVEETLGGGANQHGARGLWAANMRAPATSAWFTVEADGGPGDHVSGDRRVAIATGIAVLDHSLPELIRASAPIAGGGATVVAHGADDGVVLAILQATTMSDGAIQLEPAAAPGFQSILSQRAGGTGYDPSPVVAVHLAPVGADTSGDSIDTAAGTTNREPFDALVDLFAQRDAETLQLADGTSVVLRSDLRASPNLRFVSLERFATTVSIAGIGPDAVFVAIADSLHVASTAEWSLAPRVSESTATTPGVNFAIGGGVLGSGAGWTASVRRDGTLPWEIDLFSPRARGVAFVELPPRPPMMRAVANSAFMTIVSMAARDDAPAVLRVTVDGHVDEARFRDASPDLPGPVAAYAFDALAPYTAEAIAADGHVLATLSG